MLAFLLAINLYRFKAFTFTKTPSDFCFPSDICLEFYAESYPIYDEYSQVYYDYLIQYYEEYYDYYYEQYNMTNNWEFTYTTNGSTKYICDGDKQAFSRHWDNPQCLGTEYTDDSLDSTNWGSDVLCGKKLNCKYMAYNLSTYENANNCDHASSYSVFVDPVGCYSFKDYKGWTHSYDMSCTSNSLTWKYYSNISDCSGVPVSKNYFTEKCSKIKVDIIHCDDVNSMDPNTTSV
eukprot:877023_1